MFNVQTNTLSLTSVFLAEKSEAKCSRVRKYEKLAAKLDLNEKAAWTLHHEADVSIILPESSERLNFLLLCFKI